MFLPHSPRLSLRQPMVLAAAWAVAAVCSPRLDAASPPNWIKPYLAEDLSGWKHSKPVVALLESENVQFLANDRIRRTHREALRIVGSTGNLSTPVQWIYNPDYERIVGAQAWIIAPDGKKTQSWGKADFTDSVAQINGLFWNRQRRIFLSTVVRATEGSVIIWSFEVESDRGFFDAEWSFGSDHPVLHSQFTAQPAPGTSLVWHASDAAVPTPVSTAPTGSLRWEKRRVEPLEDELPIGFLPNPIVVRVKCVPTGGTDDHATWNAFSSVVADVVEPQITITPAIRQKAEELAAGSASRLDRIRAAAAFAQAEISYLSVTMDRDSIAGYRPNTADEILSCRYGDCKDKATLMTALLRAMGEEGYVVLVYAGNPEYVPSNWPSACFNHAIAAFPADADTPARWPTVDGGKLGRLVLFDPTDRDTPLGILPRGDQGGHGLVVHAEHGTAVRLPTEPPAQRLTTRTISMALNNNGDITADFVQRFDGSIGALWHADRFNLSEPEFLHLLQNRRMRYRFSGAEIGRWEDTWDPITSIYTLTTAIKAAKYAQMAGNRMLLIPFPVIAKGTLDPWKTAYSGVADTAGGRSVDTVTIKLPDGFTVEELPDPWESATPDSKARLTYELREDVLVCTRELETPTEFVDRAAYERLRAFIQRFSVAERRPVLLQPK